MRQNQQIVISASRRTDIPAFYMDWFMDRIGRGRFEAINPFNRKVYYIPATPDKVSTIVFWSKNYHIFLKNGYGEKLNKKGFNLFFNFTINSHDNFLEPGLPELPARLDQVRILSDTFGSDCVNWRFDPLIHYKKNNRINAPLAHFTTIAESISTVGIKRCITSFVDMYGKVKKRFDNINELEFLPIPDKKQIDFILNMEKELKKYNISLNLCCEKNLYKLLPTNSTTTHSSCIDNNLLRKLFGDNISVARDTGQRKEMGCHCKKSYDIGSYSLQPCYHNCIYCYANPEPIENRSRILENKTP